jgi:hypothetical protein
VLWWWRQRRAVKMGHLGVPNKIQNRLPRDFLRAPPPKRSAALIAALVVILAVYITVYLLWPHAPRQTVLPFTGLADPTGVAVDTTGTVYVTDISSNRVLKLPAG